MSGNGLDSREERVQQAKDRLESGFYSGEQGVELIVNSMVTLMLDKLYAEF
jgi:hypothetical protein